MSKYNHANLVPSKQVCARFSITSMTLWRWEKSPQYAHLNFPKSVRLVGRNFYDVKELDAWCNEMARRNVADKAARAERTQAGKRLAEAGRAGRQRKAEGKRRVAVDELV